MVDVVIIGHNEGKHAKALAKSIPDGWGVTYVADRCRIIDLMRIYWHFRRGEVIDTRNINLEGRQTSFCRNLGFYHRPHKDSDILFLDGDRYVTSGSLQEAYDAMTTDVLCLPLENDFRHKADFAINYGRVLSGFFSCGLFMRREAVMRVLEFQNGQIFREDMQDVWGIEDTSLGDVCYHLGLTAELSDKVTLRGGFDRIEVDSLDTIERRLQFRNNLNVRWD